MGSSSSSASAIGEGSDCRILEERREFEGFGASVKCFGRSWSDRRGGMRGIKGIGIEIGSEKREIRARRCEIRDFL